MLFCNILLVLSCKLELSNDLDKSFQNRIYHFFVHINSSSWDMMKIAWCALFGVYDNSSSDVFMVYVEIIKIFGNMLFYFFFKLRELCYQTVIWFCPHTILHLNDQFKLQGHGHNSWEETTMKLSLYENIW